MAWTYLLIHSFQYEQKYAQNRIEVPDDPISKIRNLPYEPGRKTEARELFETMTNKLKEHTTAQQG